MNATPKGLYEKFSVTRNDGRSAPGEKHDGCEYFVLDLSHDKHAMPALAAYAQSCADEFPELAADLRAKVRAAAGIVNDFVIVPETTLPGGLVVPAFEVSQFHIAKGDDGQPVIDAERAPWVEVNFEEAKAACAAMGGQLIRETQALALAWNIFNVADNWSGGAVGEGTLLQGLHDDDDLDEAPTGVYTHPDRDQRRAFKLSNGQIVYDAAGTVFSWIFDDVQGDEQGLVARAIGADSPSITTAPLAAKNKGIGWQPAPGTDWSSLALVRGGCWYSVGRAGVFNLDGGWPGYRGGRVGFRCTK
jgi:hypothetical protein